MDVIREVAAEGRAWEGGPGRGEPGKKDLGGGPGREGLGGKVWEDLGGEGVGGRV